MAYQQQSARDLEDDALLNNPSSSSFHPLHPHPHSNHTPHTSLDSHDMTKEKFDKGPPAVDIIVASDTLVLRGTGVDVNPALLSGNVVLYLSEPTSIKEITLQFRGKAKIPPSANESLALNASPLTYVVCNHEWSFLEGARSHAHTLKAGRHLFPFQLNIGGSLPSSISTSALGGASVHYKLRASVVRPGFSLGLTHRELTAIQPITILRGFSSEALEYQQTLEIENTWPEKLMYSIMIPHKAWPAGDRVAAVVKFSPLVKGARVQSVTTTINETVKLHGRGGVQENTRAIATAKHEIIDGHAVCVDERHHRYRIPLLHHSPLVRSDNPSPPHVVTGSGVYSPAPVHSPVEMSPLTTVTTNSSASSGSRGREASSSSVALPPVMPRTEDVAGPSDLTITQSAAGENTVPQEIEDEPSADVVTTLHLAVPAHATPGHTLEPMQVSHRIRWSIMIANKDGHVSELRCSLPLHILDYRLYDEAHAATLATRRLLLGARDIDGGSAVGTRGEPGEEQDDSELPSYPAHVRDRVANAYLPETATLRVTNPWVASGISPVVQRRTILSEGSSGVQSPMALEVYPYAASREQSARDQLPANPSPDAQQLHWVNSELLLSLSQQPEARPSRPIRRSPPGERTPPPEPDSAGSSRHGSRFPSRRGSRANSRANSPERGSTDAIRASTIPVPADKTYVHNSSTASRAHHGLFHISMKPFTSLTSGFGLGHRSPSHNNLASAASTHGPSGLSNITAARHSSTDITRPSSGTTTPLSSGMNTPALPSNLTDDQLLLHRAFIETPDYEIASRGFLGGGIPPLSSYAGLPSYEEASAGARSGVERSMSDTDLAGRLSGMRLSGIHQRQQQSVATAPPSPPRRTQA